jgi:hypothetical protein
MAAEDPHPPNGSSRCVECAASIIELSAHRLRENDIELPPGSEAIRKTVVAALDYAAEKLRERDDKYFTSDAAESSGDAEPSPCRRRGKS